MTLLVLLLLVILLALCCLPGVAWRLFAVLVALGGGVLTVSVGLYTAGRVDTGWPAGDLLCGLLAGALTCRLLIFVIWWARWR